MQTQERESHVRNPENDKIRKEIYRVLGEESGVDIHVRGGIVRLTGEVDTKQIYTSVETNVKEVKGVQKVINELRVKPFN